MIGKNKFLYWIRIFFLFLFSFFIIWVTVILFLGNQYLSSLLYPTCEQNPIIPEGYEKISIPFHGGTLEGLWKSSQNGAVILIMGGHASNETNMLPEAQSLSDAGYGIITTSYRHCLGETLSFGWFEVEEFEAAYQTLRKKAPGAKIGVYGFSAGAVSAIRGSSAHKDIFSIVTVGNYASLNHEIISGNYPFLSFGWQMERAVFLLYSLHVGISPKEVTVLPDLEKISPRPILLIHGEYEAIHNQAELQIQAAGEGAILKIIPNSNHGQYLDQDPLYPKIVINFFEETLK